MRKEFFLFVLRAVVCCGFFPLILLASCGRGKDEAEQFRRIGIDGYVYVAEKLPGDGDASADGNASSDSGFSLNALGKDVPEVSFYPADIYVKDGEGNFYFLSCNYSIGTVYGYAGEVLEIQTPGCRYAIYPDGSVQIQESGKEPVLQENLGEERLASLNALAHTALYKVSPQGEVLYELNLTDQLWGIEFPKFNPCLAIRKSGVLMLLLEDGIFMVDREGNPAGTINTTAELDAYTAEAGAVNKQYLTGGMDGSVYYAAESGPFIAVYEVVQKGGNFALSRADAFRNRHGSVYPGVNGILFSDLYDGNLYVYGVNGVLTPLLRWQDSNLWGSEVKSVAQVSEEELLVETLDGIYRLKRTAVEDLPERELIVVASREPSSELLEALAEFNTASRDYHVICRDYSEGVDGSVAISRLDADLVGLDPPDILDMTDLDFYKYTDKDVLEDLSGYLDASSLVHKEDFMKNVLEGYTIGGRLVCIPKSFFFTTLIGRKGQLGEASGWTMEECMGLTESYPEYCLIAGTIRDAGWVLGNVCREYCLERFVDWEENSCSFDGGEFKGLLAWIKECGEKNGKLGEPFYGWEGWQYSLLSSPGITSLETLLRAEATLGEELTMVGYPTADGKPCYRISCRNALAMVSGSLHKEGAWAFMEFFLSREKDTLREEFVGADCFPTNLERFQKMIEYYTTPEYVLEENGERRKLMDGTYFMLPKFSINGESLPYLEKEQFADVLQAIESLDFAPGSEKEDVVMEIVAEEAAAYFDGSKEVEEAAAIIQNRVSVLLGEG